MRRLLLGLVSCSALIVSGWLAVVPVGPAAASSVPPTVTASSWTAVSMPTSSQTSTLSVNGVACATSDLCFAVGRQGGPPVPLLMEWNGTAWASVTQPVSTLFSVLQGVSCAGPSFCVAVGFSGTSPTTALIETWNGSAWSTSSLPAPSPSGVAVQLYGVSCVSASSCVAVGSTTAGATTNPLSETWNGSSWQAVPVPPPSGGFSQLNAVSCVSASFCLAAGQQGVQITPTPMADEWNGSTWSPLTVAAGPGTLGNRFASVSCAGVSFCVLVGSSTTPGTGPPSTTFIETWNGQSLAVTPSPNSTSSDISALSGVACFGPTSCSAVGTSGTAFSPQTLALSWNGSSWSIVGSPNGPGSTPAGANAVTCVTDWACVAVGQYVTDAGLSENQPFAMSAPIARSGYRFVASDGGVFTYGAGAPFLGSMGGQHLNKPIVGMGVMPAGDGYYLVASDGGIFSYGSAQFYGSTGSMQLNQPVVGMAVTPDGAGYWLVASDGGIFSYGDAQFYGSTGSLHLNKPIVGMATTPDGKGYYLVASDGGIFSYGDAAFEGSTGSLVLNKPVVGMAVPTSGGYYLVASDGGIFTFPTNGGPPFEGSTGSIHLNKPIVGMTTAAGGYYLSGSDGGVFAFPPTNGPPFLGSTGSIQLNAPIVGIAG